MITINKKNPTAGEVTSSLTNAEDGGLHFDGASSHISLANSAGAEFGTSDFSIEFILNQTKASTNETYYFTAPHTGDNRMGLWYDKTNTTLKIYFRTSSNTHYSFGYDMANDFGTPTHFVVTADRDGNATLYKNGTSISSVDISGSSAVNIGDGNANPFFISANSANTALIGTLSRFRTFNKLADAKKLFERSDIDFSEQWGSQTKVIDSDFNGSLDGWNTYNDWNTQTNNSNAMQLAASAATQVCRNSVSLIGGKKYRVEYTASALTGAPTFNCYDSGTYTAKHTITAGSNSFEMDWPVGQSVDFLYIRAESATAAVTLDDIFVYQIGAVSSYELQTANPSQSLMVQDSSGAADGTCSASGVSQIQPLTQINAVSGRIGSNGGPETPADGELIASKVNVTSSGNGEIICSRDSGAAARLQTQSSAVTFGVTSNHDLQFLTNNTVYARLTNAGNFGVNVASPGFKLDVEESTGNEIARFQGANSGSLVMRNDAANVFRMYAGAGDSLGFSGGNVSGSSHLEISSAGVATLTNSNSGLVLKNSGASNKEWRVGGGSGGEFDITEVGNADRLSIAPGGLVTVSNQIKVTSSNASTVAFSVGDAGTGLYNTGSNAIGLATNGVQRLNVDSSGEIIVNDSTGTEAGRITTIGNNLTISGSVADHCGFSFATNSILPTTISATNNNIVSLGQNGNGFKDLYLGGEAKLAGITTLGSLSELTIASGGITITSTSHTVDTEGDAASDNLNTINGGSNGSILILCSLTDSRDTTLKDGSDNLRLNGDFTLSSSTDTITLIKRGTLWIEISRSDNS